VRDVAAVIIALRGPWAIAPHTAAALADARVAVIDLSAPPAIPTELATVLGSRLITIDDLARRPVASNGDRLVRRLSALVDETVAEYVDWLERQSDRDTARAMVTRAEGTRRDELDHLWRRLPDLGDLERAEIERMTQHLAARLLRDPLARLGDDEDGQRARAARELFGL